MSCIASNPWLVLSLLVNGVVAIGTVAVWLVYRWLARADQRDPHLRAFPGDGE